jgi:hypothetical protein
MLELVMHVSFVDAIAVNDPAWQEGRSDKGRDSAAVHAGG